MTENIKELQKHLGLRQRAVAKEAGMDAGKLSRIENGWLEPMFSEIERLKTAIAKLAEGK
jgi:predicted transcriptional regulator